MTSEETNHHSAFWAKVKDHAGRTESRVCNEPEPMTKAEVIELLAYAIRCGNPKEKAEAIVAASEWMHACNELKYKEEK